MTSVPRRPLPWMPHAGCGARLGPGNCFYERIVCDGIDGEPTLDNCAVLCKTCWRLKTDRYDLPVVAKAKRVGDIVRNIRSAVFRPIPGTMASGIKKPLRPYARPVDRRTGREI